MSRTALVSKSPRTGTPDPQPSVNTADLQQYADEWLLHCEFQQNSKATLTTRRIFIEKFFWFLKHREMESCGRSELREFLHYLRTGHEESGGRWGNPQLTKPLRPISVKDYYNCLRIFFEWMLREEIITVSPLDRVDPPKAREEVKQPLTSAQTQALLNAARNSNHPRRDEAILLMLFDSGVRASELVGIKVSDIDLKSGSFEVIGKGDKRRTCYMGKNTAKVLMTYLRKSKLPPFAPLFPSTKGRHEPLTRSGLLHLIKRLAKTAGVSANVHQLRRTFATSMLHAGADICSVRDLLGHTKIQMTLKYLSVAQSHIESQHRQFSPADRLDKE